MKFQRRQLVAAMAGLMLGLSAGAASAMGGPSGAAVGMPAQGHIGEVIVNPYKIAPLTAIVRTGGYVVKNASVRVVPKKGGREIAYKVSDRQIRTHAGIPIAGLYADYLNTVEVSYTRVSADGKSEDFTDRLQFYAPPVFSISNGMPGQQRMFNVEVNKVDPGFEDRLYLVNSQLIPMAPQGARFVWNNPAGGALEWTINSQIGIIDTAGDVRWYLLNDLINDQSDPWTSGLMMGFQQTKDGALTWGFGQRWVKYDLMGREIFNRKLPPTYADFSHAYDNAENGHSFLRVSMADYRRGDDKWILTAAWLMISASMTFSIRIATRSLRRLIRGPCASTSILRRPVRRFRLRTSPTWIRATSSATSRVRARDATGRTSIPLTTIRPMIRLSCRHAIKVS